MPTHSTQPSIPLLQLRERAASLTTMPSEVPKRWNNKAVPYWRTIPTALGPRHRPRQWWPLFPDPFSFCSWMYTFVVLPLLWFCFFWARKINGRALAFKHISGASVRKWLQYFIHMSYVETYKKIERHGLTVRAPGSKAMQFGSTGYNAFLSVPHLFVFRMRCTINAWRQLSSTD